MGKTYDQFDIDERYEIYRLREAGVSLSGDRPHDGPFGSSGWFHSFPRAIRIG